MAVGYVSKYSTIYGHSRTAEVQQEGVNIALSWYDIVKSVSALIKGDFEMISPDMSERKKKEPVLGNPVVNNTKRVRCSSTTWHSRLPSF